MEFIVCVKKVLDPDLPPAKFAVDTKKNLVIPPEGIPYVINPYTAVAVEAGLKIKEGKGGRVTVITLGDKSADDITRKALAMGADEGLILSDPSFEECDGFGTAHVLSQAIKKNGKYDLILCGRQAVGSDSGIVRPAIAEYLGIPVVSPPPKVKAPSVTIPIDDSDSQVRFSLFPFSTDPQLPLDSYRISALRPSALMVSLSASAPRGCTRDEGRSLGAGL